MRIGRITFYLIGLLTVLSFQPTFASQPNVLLILLDDLRYNDFSSTGAPAFFQTPNIDKIANEGATFENAFVVLSLCKPSRATMLTGLYAHLHGVTGNDACFCTDSTLLLPYRIQQEGYSTGFIGKYHFATQPQANYDKWVSYPGGNGYINLTYNIDGLDSTISGHLNENLTDFAIDYVSQSTTQPFFLTLSHKTPHTPVVPPSEFKGIYDSINIPIAQPGANDLINKPSFVYNYCNSPIIPNVETTKQKYYEALKSVDIEIGRLFDTLTSLNILDSTIVIVTSDNGFILGEHGSYGKRLAYEESMRIPILIRYPKSIPAGLLVQNNIALNLDIPQTILHASGSAYQTQGKSLMDMISGSENRTEFLYQYNQDPGGGLYSVYPSFRSIRTLEYKYNRYACTEQTEELYNIVTDPNELTNLIFDQSYTAVINTLRSKLDSLKLVYGDTATLDTISCSIVTYNACCPTATGMLASAVSEHTALLSWDSLPESYNYEIRGREFGTSNWIYFQASTNQQNLINLKQNTTYQWQVRSTCDTSINYLAAWSDIDTFKTKKECLQSALISTTIIGETKVVLNWDPVPGAYGYRLLGKALGSQSLSIVTFGPNDTSLIVNNINPNLTYVWTVRTLCNASFTEFSDVQLIDTFRTGRAKLSADQDQTHTPLNSFSVYPNPTNGSFTVSIENWDKETAQIMVLDNQGRFVSNSSISPDDLFATTQIDLSNQPKGLYVVKIQIGERQYLRKILLQ